MSFSMTERDKRLLSILAVAVFLIVFFRFAILPAWESYTDNTAALEAAENTKSDMEYNISLRDSAKQMSDRSAQDLQAASATYYAPLTNDALDSLITGLELQHGLSPISMTITEANVMPISAYVYSMAGIMGGTTATTPTTDLDAAAATAGEGADTTAATATSLSDPIVADNSCLQTATVSFTANGTRAQIFALLDDLFNNRPSLRVTNYALNKGTSAETAEETQDEAPSEFSCTVNVYMYVPQG